MKRNKWTVYILECGDGTLYTGITTDLEKRVYMHEIGQGAKYTRGRAPFKVLYSEVNKSKSSALKRELEIKGLNKKDKLMLIHAY